MRYLCDTCAHCKGTYKPTYTDSGGVERSIAIEYVHCECRWTRRKLKDWEWCMDYEDRKGRR